MRSQGRLLLERGDQDAVTGSAVAAVETLAARGAAGVTFPRRRWLTGGRGGGSHPWLFAVLWL